jgi:hypothetical protein
MNTLSQLYDVIWSILAIVGGTLILFFREGFLKRNASGFDYLYKKTNVILFKRQAEGMETASMRVVATIVAIGLVLLGLFTLARIIL